MLNTGLPAVLAFAIWVNVLLIVLAVIVVILVVLMVIGNKMQKKQMAQKEQMDAMAQTVSMLIIDKKVMRLRDAQLPKEVFEQTPKYMRRSKIPFVKAKVGSRIMTLMSDPKVFAVIPVKKEIKAVVSGIYITEIKSVRGGFIPQPEQKKKKGLFGRKKKKDKDK